MRPTFSVPVMNTSTAFASIKLATNPINTAAAVVITTRPVTLLREYPNYNSSRQLYYDEPGHQYTGQILGNIGRLMGQGVFAPENP